MYPVRLYNTISANIPARDTLKRCCWVVQKTSSISVSNRIHFGLPVVFQRIKTIQPTSIWLWNALVFCGASIIIFPPLNSAEVVVLRTTSVRCIIRSKRTFGVRDSEQNGKNMWVIWNSVSRDFFKALQ